MNRCAAGVVLVTTCVTLSGCANADDTDVQALHDTLRRYIQSVNTADPVLGGEVWAQTSEVIAVTPLGRFQGWQHVHDDLYVNFLQKAFLERNLTPSHEAFYFSRDMASVTFDWTFQSKLANGQPYASTGWETHVYRKIDRTWRLVHLHYSAAMPPAAPAATQ